MARARLKSSPMKAVLILPTYNERENILTLLDGLEKAARQIKNHTLLFLVVDDNSPDGTAQLVAQYQKTHGNVYLLTGKKQGLGKALLRGMIYASGELGAELLMQMDADLSHDPRVVPQFFAALDGGADFVVGSRYIPGGSIPENWGLHRKIFSVVGNAIVRFGLGYAQIHDWTGGFRLFHRRYFEAAKSELVPFSGYVFQIAFLHKSVSGGARVSEVPIKFTDRQHGHSKIAPSQYIRDVLIYVAAVRLRRLWQGPFWKFCVVGTIGFVINTLVLEVLVALGFHPAAGSALGAEMAIISNFILNNAWTFGERKVTGNRMIPKFLQFNATSVGAIVIQAGTVWLGTLIFGVTLYRWYYILGVGLGLIWNYTMYSKVIWRK